MISFYFKKMIVFIFIMHLCAPHAHSQRSLSHLEQLISDEKYKEIKEVLPAFRRNYPDHPTVLYVQGLIEPNAQRAVSNYQKVVQETNSAYADDACLRIGQYYYAMGKTDQAQQYFSHVTRLFPNSNLKDEAIYLFCQCLRMENKEDSAKLCMKAFIKKFPRSPYVDLAIMDLESMPRSTKKQKRTTQQRSDCMFSIQVGAFRWPQNAERLTEKLKQEGLNADTHEKRVNGRLYHVVWIGCFYTKAQAIDYANRHLKKRGYNTQIVPFES